MRSAHYFLLQTNYISMATGGRKYGSSEINDIRAPTHFRGFSFSNFKKTEVCRQMLQNMQKGRVEPACYWAAELICAGHFLDVWETLFYYLGKHIHLANPKMAIYVQMRYIIFRNILQQGLFSSELQLRNHPDIRGLFAELVCNLTLCNKKPAFESIKINRVEEFDMTQLTERLKANSTHYAESVFQKDDPKELSIALNELGFHLSPEQRSMNSACYWIEWIVEFDLVCKKRKAPVRCAARNYVGETKFRRDIIWMVWDILFQVCENMKNPFVSKTVQALHELFCVKYTTAAAKRRRYLLYFTVAMLVEPFAIQTEIVANKSVLESVVSQIDSVYKQIKENEQSPNTEYLFQNMDAETNFLKMVQRMEMVQNMDVV